mgnify:CR=1 FL=1
MITLVFILIAYALRKRYLPENPPVMLKVLYYGSFVVLTPIVGVIIFRSIDFNTPIIDDNEEPCGFPMGVI